MLRKGIPINSESLRKIAAIVDIQGFFLPHSQRFYGREIAVVSISGFEKVLNIKPNIDKIYLHWTDKRAIDYVENHIHGIPIEVPREETYIHTNWLKEALHTIQILFASKDQPYLACKNHHVAWILNNFGIEFVNLEFGTLVCPKSTELDQLYNTFWTCPRHIPVEGKVFTCALRKALNIASWVRAASLPILFSSASLRYGNICQNDVQDEPMDEQDSLQNFM